MRQGGMRPHGHGSQTYWTRAALPGGNSKQADNIPTLKEPLTGPFVAFITLAYLIIAICVVPEMTWLLAIILIVLWLAIVAGMITKAILSQ